jgi:hypothetical protein
MRPITAKTMNFRKSNSCEVRRPSIAEESDFVVGVERHFAGAGTNVAVGDCVELADVLVAARLSFLPTE